VTFALGLQYGLLVLLPAFRRDLPLDSIVVTAPIVVIVISAYLETVARRFRSSAGSGFVPPSQGLGIAVVGVVATVVQTLLGAGTYASQIGDQDVSPLASLFTPFSYWMLIGASIVIFSWTQGNWSRGKVLAVLGALVGFQLIWSTAVVGITAPGMKFAVVITIAAATLRLFRLRHVVIVTTIAFLVWPQVYELRQVTRFGSVGVEMSEAELNERAGQRLELDRLLEYADTVSIAASQLPTPMEILRFGLIPRVLDPNRPNVAVGSVFSVAIGGSSVSASNFTTVGSLIAIGGWTAIILYSVGAALMVAILLRRNNAWAFAAFALAASELLWIETNYPQNVMAFLQGLVSLAGAYLAVRLWRVAIR
jgi:hypothetical protein